MPRTPSTHSSANAAPEASRGPFQEYVKSAPQSVRACFAKKISAELLRPFLTDKRETNLGAPAPYLVTRKLGLPPHYSCMLALSALDADKVCSPTPAIAHGAATHT